MKPHWSLTTVTDSTAEPITTAEAKAHLRVDIPDDDSYIDSLISACRRKLEREWNRAFVNQTLRATYDTFPLDGGPIRLPRPPLTSTTSDIAVTYTNSTGGSSTWSSSDYQVDSRSEPGRILPAFGQSYPSTRNVQNAVTVQYVAGYGGSTDIPDTIRHAVKLMVGHYYENREPVVVGTIVAQIPDTVLNLMGAEDWGPYG